MRNNLEKSEGVRGKFRGIFVRIGSKINFKGHAEETILLKEIRFVETNKVVTDHLWFAYTKGFQLVSLSEGVTIEFEARIKMYTKGYVNKRYGIDRRKEDYRLSHPTRIHLVI